MKHHYVPQFLLRRWTDAGGKLHSLAIRNGQVVCHERAPKYTGYEDGLYAVVANALGLSGDHIEKKLFGPIDNNAADVLKKLESKEVLSEEEHIAWTFFLSSLRMRQPDVIHFLRTQGMDRVKRAMAERDASSLPVGWPTTEEWFTRNYPGAVEAASMTSWLLKLILHPDVLDAFGGLKWWFREFQEADGSLLLSDLPIHLEGGLHKPNCVMHLPIGPQRLFLGTRSVETEQILSQMPPAELINRANRTSLASSAGRIWASACEPARTFVETNRDDIGKNVQQLHSLPAWVRPEAEADEQCRLALPE